MKVKELIKLLTNFNQEDIVIMSSDSEGNNYSPLASIYTGSYRAKNSYSGEVGILELTPALIKAGFSEEDILEDSVPCVLLGPTN
jgi:hypothetical protein